MAPPLKLAHSKYIGSVVAHESRPVRRTAIAALFALTHALVVSYAISTAGEPYAQAVAQAARLDNGTESNGTALNASLPLGELPADDVAPPATATAPTRMTRSATARCRRRSGLCRTSGCRRRWPARCSL